MRELHAETKDDLAFFKTTKKQNDKLYENNIRHCVVSKYRGKHHC